MSTFTPTIPSTYSDRGVARHSSELAATTASGPGPAIERPGVARRQLLADDLQHRSIRLDAAEPAATTCERVTAISLLAKSAVAELRFLCVDENTQTIHLTGRVRSFYHKQLAQEAMRPIAAGRQVINRVDVCDHV